jgi:hypothetical protein
MVTTTTDPGQISVPMSSILDALEGVLTEDERTALFQQLIGITPAGVAPGDLTTAELFNSMLGNINDLQVRVAQLEGASGGPIVDLLDPATTVAINSALTVTGRNFNPEPRNNIVTIGDIQINQFRGDSTATSLIFAVPDMFTGLPAPFPVRVVTGDRTSNAMSITITEQEKIQAGNFVLHNTAIPAGTITASETLSFTWSVQAVTIWDDNVALSLQVGQVTGTGVTAADWQSSVQFQPASPMAISTGATANVTVTLKVPAKGGSAQIALQVTSADGHVTNVSDPITIATGSSIDGSDSKITISPVKLLALGGGTAVAGTFVAGGINSSGVLVSVGTSGKVKFDITDTRPAGTNPAIDYQYTTQFLDSPAGFSVGALVPAGDTAIPYGGARSVEVPLTVQGGSTVGATTRLKIICTQTKTGTGLASYSSFRILPLKIAS